MDHFGEIRREPLRIRARQARVARHIRGKIAARHGGSWQMAAPPPRSGWIDDGLTV